MSDDPEEYSMFNKYSPISIPFDKIESILGREYAPPSTWDQILSGHEARIAELTNRLNRAEAQGYEDFVRMHQVRIADLNRITDLIAELDVARKTITQLRENQDAPQPEALDTTEAFRKFEEYVVRNYPGPDTIISNPKCHAPKLWKAAIYALKSTKSDSAEKKENHG